MHFTSTDTYAPMSLTADEQFLLLTDEPIQDHAHSNLKYMKSLIWLYLTEISQHATT